MAHRVVEIEHDLFVVAAARHADHVVGLHFAAGADAEVALDAGVEIDRHRRMAAVEVSGVLRRGNRLSLTFCRSAVFRSIRSGSCATSFGGWSVSSSSTTILRAVFARSVWVLTFMPGVGVQDAARGEHALALDLHHADAAIAVRAVAGLGQIAPDAAA